MEETQGILDAIGSWLQTVSIVPDDYREYAQLVVDGLLFFLGRLPADRLEAIVAAQLAIPEDASADDRLVALVRECPTLHKLGQVIARQAGLPLELRARLQALESLVPPAGSYDVPALVAREIGAIPGLSVEGDAFAEGSVAFVAGFTWEPEPGAPVRHGVFKALKPGAQARLLEDLAIWPDLGVHLAERSHAAGLPRLDFRTLLDGVAHLLRSEIRLDLEQERMAQARRWYAGSTDVVIPELFAFCTPRLTAMERIDGVKVTDPSVPPATRRKLARTIVGALLAKPFWTPEACAPFFHADPHAGNLFATPQGKLAIFDWALTTRLSEAQAAAVVQSLASAAMLDELGVRAALAELGDIVDAAAVCAGVAAAIGAVRRGAFPGFGWLTPLLDDLGRSGAMSFPESTALFRKLLLTLTGVIRDVCPGASIDDVLIAGGGRQFRSESWRRPLAPYDSRAFGTHVSNRDLVALLGSFALTPARYMLGMYRDALDLILR